MSDNTPTLADLIDKAMAAGFPRGELFGLTRRQATRIVEALEVEKLHEYIRLLERGFGAHEAREEVWSDE